MRSPAFVVLLLAGVACASGETSVGGDDDDEGGAGGMGGAAGGGGEGGTGGSAVVQYAHFVVTGGDGMDRDETWMSPGNFVSCAGKTALAMRFAANAAGGDEGDHVDVDVFGYDGAGTYDSVSCGGAGCPPAPPGTFSVWYHPNGRATPIYTNDSTSTSCSLTIAVPEADVLEGSWACANVANIFATGTSVDLTGDFRCVVSE